MFILLNRYYMTVSDDSADDTYACIYEGGSRGTGSETYAQIEPRISPSATQQPSTQASSTALPSSPTAQLSRSQEQSPPAPPSVDSLRNVVHSRQGKWLLSEIRFFSRCKLMKIEITKFKF